MHTLMEIDDCAMTRFLMLKNTATGETEECFDDSELIGRQNFMFMELGETYDCKIELFGMPVSQPTPQSVTCKIVDANVVIGKKVMVEVMVGDNRYYIPRKQVHELLPADSLEFEVTRRNLIQVDDVIHGDFWSEW